MRKGEELSKVKDSTRTSCGKLSTNGFIVEVGGRFLHHYSCQVWTGMPASHRNKSTARWCLMVLIKGIVKQFVCCECHRIAFAILLLCEKLLDVNKSVFTAMLLP